MQKQEETELTQPAEVSEAKHFKGMHVEGTACIEIDYLNEIPHAVNALHERADQLEKGVKQGKFDDPEQVDNEIVDLRLVAEKLEDSDPV